MYGEQWLINFGFAAVMCLVLVKYVMMFHREDHQKTNRRIDNLQHRMILLTIVIAKSNGIDYDKVRRNYQNGSGL